MNQLLMQNYLRCCRERLRLWVSEAVSVELSAQNSIRIELGEQSMDLDFSPEDCRWQLFARNKRSVGNFSELTKRCRQYLTQA